MLQCSIACCMAPFHDAMHPSMLQDNHQTCCSAAWQTAMQLSMLQCSLPSCSAAFHDAWRHVKGADIASLQAALHHSRHHGNVQSCNQCCCQSCSVAFQAGSLDSLLAINPLNRFINVNEFNAAFHDSVQQLVQHSMMHVSMSCCMLAFKNAVQHSSLQGMRQCCMAALSIVGAAQKTSLLHGSLESCRAAFNAAWLHCFEMMQGSLHRCIAAWATFHDAWQHANAAGYDAIHRAKCMACFQAAVLPSKLQCNIPCCRATFHDVPLDTPCCQIVCCTACSIELLTCSLSN